MIYNWNGNTTIGIALLLYGILIILFPPKYGDDMFGILTKMTMRNKDAWVHGQKLFAYALMAMALIFIILSILKNLYNFDYLISLFIFFASWILTKYAINRILIKKYSN